MRRLTRRIGVFGGPGAAMPQMGVTARPGSERKEVGKLPQAPAPRAAKPATSVPETGKKPSWLRRFFGSKPE
jgi:hypothetical protein